MKTKDLRKMMDDVELLDGTDIKGNQKIIDRLWETMNNAKLEVVKGGKAEAYLKELEDRDD